MTNKYPEIAVTPVKGWVCLRNDNILRCEDGFVFRTKREAQMAFDNYRKPGDQYIRVVIYPREQVYTEI
jgi:hypothetical protein